MHVNFFTTTSCTYYKIRNLLSNEAEVYKKVMLVCDHLCITHSFSVTCANIAINSISIKTRFFGLHFCCRKYRCIFNRFYVGLMRLKATEFDEITHGNGLCAVIKPFKVIQSHRFWYQSKAHIRLSISD